MLPEGIAFYDYSVKMLADGASAIRIRWMRTKATESDKNCVEQ